MATINIKAHKKKVLNFIAKNNITWCKLARESANYTNPNRLELFYLDKNVNGKPIYLNSDLLQKIDNYINKK